MTAISGTVALAGDVVDRDPADSHPADGTAADSDAAGLDSAPMTFGQLSLWRDITGVPRSRWHEANVIDSFPLARAVSRQELCQVLTRLYAKHHSLRTIYDVADPAHPRQRLLPAEPVEDVEVCYRDEAELSTVMDELAKRPFDLSRDRQIRVLAVSDGPRSADPAEPNIDRLVVCVHHIACDGWSMGLLRRDVRALLGLGPEEVPEPEQSLLAIGQEQHSHPSWQRKLKATQRHFRAVYEAGSTNFRDYDPNAGALQVTIASRDVYEPALALAESHNVTVASVFTAAFVDAVASYCHPGPVRVGLMTSNRFQQRWHHLVTSMNQRIPISVDGDPTADFGQRLAQVHLAALRAYRLGHYDVDQMTEAALGVSSATSQLKSFCSLNVVLNAPPELVGLEAPGQSSQLQWEPVFSRISEHCYLRVFMSPQGMVRLRLRVGGLDRDTVAGILLATQQRILDYAG